MQDIFEVVNKIDYKPQYGGSVVELVDEIEKDRVMIAGMFPKGAVSAVIAESGIGKTWVMAASSLSVTSGIPFLPTEDYEPIDNGRVLIIDTEGRILTFIKRVRELGGKIQYYITPRQNPREIAIYASPEDREAIELILKHEKPDLVIVDSFAGFSTVDENTNEVLASLQWMGALASKYDAAFVFTQLTNKSEQRGGRVTTKSIRGFSGIHQWAEIIWGLDVPTPDSTVKRLYQVKNNVGQISNADFIFELNESKIVWKDGTTDKKQQRYKVIRENKKLSNIEIARKIMEVEPNCKLKSLEIWVARNRAKITT